MSYQVLTDFKYGMNRTRERVAGVPGTLWLGENIHITRGGDIQRAKKFVDLYTLPANTFGMGQLYGQLYVFGSAAAPTMPTGVQYQRLQAADTSAEMVEVLDVDNYDGKFYVIARYDNGELHHFYNGSRVTQWDTISAAQADQATLASYMAELIDADADVSAIAVGDEITITARVAGTPFNITKSTADVGGTGDQNITLTVIQPNVAEVAEVRATATCEVLTGSAGTVEDMTINGVLLMRAAVSWATSHTATAARIVTQINNKTATHGYTAEANGAQFTITAAPGTGDTPNEYVVAASVTGDVTISTPSMAGGVDAVEPVAQVNTALFSGTIEAADRYTIQINDAVYSTTPRAAATGTSAFVHKKRVWSPSNTLENYSKINDATDWTDNNVSSGAGFIRMSRESEGAERLIGGAPYGGQAAFFSRNAIQVWTIDTDAENNVIDKTLGNTGSLAARSIIPYGNLDVFYLDEPGVRSLRAKDQSGEAYAADVGNAIDSFVREYIDTLTEEQVRRAVSVIGPEGRYWLAVGQYIFVLSYFPGSKIAAWSYYDFGQNVSDFARVRNKVYARAGDTIYLYGGLAGTTYPDDDEMVAKVYTPFLTAQIPATMKHLTSFDIACTGQWAAALLVDPNDDAKAINVGVLSRTTYNNPQGRIGIPGESTHFALNLTCSKAGPATISSVTVHYEKGEAD